MIIISWTTFSLSWLVNILDYMFIHPSMPDTDLGRFPNKLVIYILGKRVDIRATWREQCTTGISDLEKPLIIPSDIKDSYNDCTSHVVIQMENI